MAYELSDLKMAYKKLKSYIYYDNTDILLRKQLVEFETNKTKDMNTLFGSSPKPYKFENIFTIGRKIPVNEKLEVLTKMLNEYGESEESIEFFDYLFSKLSVNFFPKKIKNSDVESDPNFISNVRVSMNYELERVTSFVNAPIEFHILSVLWIMDRGYQLDSKLSDSCYGNRLLLNGDRDNVVQGSGLFKPYFNQYQSWRDDSVTTATELLEKNKNVLFINLDIKDYFHSVRMKVNDVFGNNDLNKLSSFMKRLHIDYTLQVSSKYQVPENFTSEIINDNDEVIKVILPIGLLSSYILANDYLKKFDKEIEHTIKPAFYGRYVDDILMVISPSAMLDEDDNLIELSSNGYSKTERIISGIFEPIIKVQRDERNGVNNFKLSSYESLFCQSAKSLVYYFKHSESSLVIDKLKKELDERSSEFRDIPLDTSDDSFEKSAYHLLYDNSEGKIRTLKDYKEDRFGLTVFLSTKIFTALRQQKQMPSEEIDKILKFFKGENCIDFYRMWEKIFTLFLVNNNAKAYVDFYLHCVEQIDKISNNDRRKKHITDTKVEHEYVSNTLIEYLDSAHEIALSLNPNFLKKAKKASLHFEFQCKKLETTSYTFFFSRFEPTNPKSFWLQRYRESNMVRDKYIVQPLLNYTKMSKEGWQDLTSLNINYSDYILDDYLLENSPRPVRFWECSLAYAFKSFGEVSEIANDSIKQTILSSYIESNDDEVKSKKFYLDKVYELYTKLNQNHLPLYKFDDSLKNKFYKYEFENSDINNDIDIVEITTNNDEKAISNPKLAFANTRVWENNIVSSLRGKPNISQKRYQEFAGILKKARVEKTDILLFPEFFIPINLLSSLVRFSERNQVQSSLGLEHITINNQAFNFVVSILPVVVNGIKDAVVVFRLKNHYAHIEELMIEGNHYKVPKPNPLRYDIINWNNIYFSIFYCFELANVYHRSLMKSKIDLMIGIEWNKDTPYFSNIVEATSRDIHSYFAQVNTSHFGDTRLTRPSKSAIKDILRLKGGDNDAILIAQINIESLREFQRTKFAFSKDSVNYKPLPPDFNVENVIKRMENKSIL
ncbi:RNA-dependent RNA polymerase family protein [Tenacibaculum maritimum]|uniref:hypothetical protein n=1 Tax=Tenacibaculum maritimum TaxID=107401 RepID=UPI0012E4EF60|nr:hypothetical protein [Tenacibaculum maritimum]CAA0221930.1 conserved hypothetical protein [Tenacibaculum maritimum]